MDFDNVVPFKADTHSNDIGNHYENRDISINYTKTSHVKSDVGDEERKSRKRSKSTSKRKLTNWRSSTNSFFRRRFRSQSESLHIEHSESVQNSESLDIDGRLYTKKISLSPNASPRYSYSKVEEYTTDQLNHALGKMSAKANHKESIFARPSLNTIKKNETPEETKLRIAKELRTRMCSRIGEIKNDITKLIRNLELSKYSKRRTFTDQKNHEYRQQKIKGIPKVTFKDEKDTIPIPLDSDLASQRPSCEYRKGIRNIVALAREGKLVRIRDADGGRIIDLAIYGHITHFTFTADPSWYIIFPNSKLRVFFDILIMLALVYYMVELPLEYGFHSKMSSYPTDNLEIFFTILFTIDIIMQFFSGFIIQDGVDHGSIETRLRLIGYRYLSKWFICDAISTIPFGLLDSGHQSLQLFRLLKLLRFLRFSTITSNIEQYFRSRPAISRLVRYIFVIAVICHVMGAGYWAVCGFTDWSGTWPYRSKHDHSDDPNRDWDFTKQWVFSVLWAIWISTGTGFPEPPATNVQACFTILVTLVGIFAYAFIVGSVFRIMADKDEETKEKETRIQKMCDFLSQREVPQRLIDNVIGYYEYCWARGIHTDGGTLFTNLHSSLRRTMKLFINQHIIMKVPMFHNITEPCLEMLIEMLHSRIYLPDEWVVIKDDAGEEMFFVVRGKFEVLRTLKSKRIFTLKPGNSFGEMALLMNQTRNCCIRSICHGELLVLHQKQFKEILREFPIFSINLQKWSPQVRLSRGWNKIRHGVRLCKALSDLGLHQSFEGMMREICVGNSDRESTTSKITLALKHSNKSNSSDCSSPLGKIRSDQVTILKAEQRNCKRKSMIIPFKIEADLSN